MSRSDKIEALIHGRQEQPFNMEEALHGRAWKGPGDRDHVGLVEVLKRIPTEHRQAVFDAAIQKIDAAERRASLERALKDKINAMSSDEIEQFLKGAALGAIERGGPYRSRKSA
jgi:hypothetical protein